MNQSIYIKINFKKVSSSDYGVKFEANVRVLVLSITCTQCQLRSPMWFPKQSKQTRLLQRWQPIWQNVVFFCLKHRLQCPLENGIGQCPASELAGLPWLLKSRMSSFASST